MSGDVWELFGVMMTLLITGGLGYGMVLALNYFNRRLKGSTPDVIEALEHLRERVVDLEALSHEADPLMLTDRLRELEERVDFAERVMARAPREELPAPDTPVTGS